MKEAANDRAAGAALQRFEAEDGLVGYRAPLLLRLGIPHLFTTRIGGDARDEIDLGNRDGTLAERVAAAAGLRGASLVTVRQVHGAGVLVLSERTIPPATAEADALISERGDVLIGVHVADCVPVLLARSDGRRVAAVHAGWRGLVAGVIPRTLELLGSGEFVAAIGPCLSCTHFEVGPEAEDAFQRAGLAAAIEPHPGARAHIDLRAAARIQLAVGGIERIDSTDRCTYIHAQELFSYRRDVTHGGKGRTGRLGALIAATRQDMPSRRL